MKINRWTVLFGAFLFQVLSWFDIRAVVAGWFGQDPTITPVQAACGATSLALYVVFLAIRQEPAKT